MRKIINFMERKIYFCLALILGIFSSYTFASIKLKNNGITNYIINNQTGEHLKFEFYKGICSVRGTLATRGKTFLSIHECGGQVDTLLVTHSYRDFFACKSSTFIPSIALSFTIKPNRFSSCDIVEGG